MPGPWPNVFVKGILPDCLVTVVDVKWYGSAAVRALFYLEHTILDGRTDKAGNRRVVSRQLQFVETVFVDAPVLAAEPGPIPERLRRLVQKFDPVERDCRNRSLGKAGESFVVDLERRQLAEADRADLARKVRWVAAEDGDGAGYDILSFGQSGWTRLIEVKTTNCSARTPCYLNRNERDLAKERPAEWRTYRVHLFAYDPHIFTIEPPLEASVSLRPETWRASFDSERPAPRE